MKGWTIILAVIGLGLASDLSGQWLYLLGHKSTSRYLQRINTVTLEVVDVVRIPLPELTDIAFHPDGTLYAIEFSDFSILDTITGLTTLVKSFSGFDAVGLAIDYNGIFYLSGMFTATQEFAVIRYNKDSDEIKKIASFLTYNFTHLDDLDFYNGNLYAVGLLPQGFSERQALFKVDTLTSINHDTITTYDLGQSGAIGSFNDSCHSLSLVAISSRQLQFFYPDLDSVKFVEVLSPPNFRSGGATTKSGWMGSLPPLLINDISIVQNPCEPSQLAEITVEHNQLRELATYFSLDGIAYQDSNHFTDILPGKYQVYLQDAWGCEVASDTFQIIASGGFNYDIEITAAYCNLNNGTLNVTSSDSLFFSVDKVNFYFDTLFDSLSPGELILFVLNNEGCLDSNVIYISTIEPPTISLSSSPESCNQANGEISTEVNLGIPPFLFSLNGLSPQNNGGFQNLSAGLHEVIVSDGLGCSATDTITVDFIDGPQIDSIVFFKPSCGMSDGEITVYASSDLSPILYLLNSGTPISSNTFTSLPSGTYSVSVVDTFGCPSNVDVVLAEKTPVSILNIDSQAAHCNTNTGSLNVEVSSGENLLYSINGGSPQSTPTFSGLYPGNYLVSAINDDGCSDTMSTFIANAHGISIDSISVTDASCNLSNGSIQIHANGIEADYSLNNGVPQSISIFLGLSQGNYLVTAMDVNGCTDTSFVSIQQPGSPSIKHIESLPEHCNLSDGGLVIAHGETGSLPLFFSINGGILQLDSIFVGLKSGYYIINITDTNGCSDTAMAEVSLIEGPFIASTYVIPELCEQGNAELKVIANSPFPLSYKLENTVSITGNFLDLSSGNYSITVEDPYGCRAIEQVSIGDSSNLSIQEIITKPTECNKTVGSIEVVSDENIEIYIEELPSQSWNSVINELSTGEYTLKLVNQDGCSLDSIVRISEECEVFMPNTFSPNGDNVNDVFGTSNLSSVSKWELSIFDRSGNMLFYSNNPLSGWDGTYKGKFAQVGVYVWHLVYRIANEEDDFYRFGDVTIIR